MCFGGSTFKKIGTGIAAAAALWFAPQIIGPLIGQGTTAAGVSGLTGLAGGGGGGVTLANLATAPAFQGAGITAAKAGSSSILGFLTSPGFAVGTAVIGFGVTVAGQQAQLKMQQSQFALREAALASRKIAIAGDIKLEGEAERERQRLLGEAGKRASGDAIVKLAALGQLVNEGSAADITEEIAGETAYKQLLSQHQSELRIRDFRIASTSLDFDTAGIKVSSQAATQATRLNQFGSGINLATGFSRFRRGSGGLAFRTPRIA